jgi:hypothetical protein
MRQLHVLPVINGAARSNVKSPLDHTCDVVTSGLAYSLQNSPRQASLIGAPDRLHNAHDSADIIELLLPRR